MRSWSPVHGPFDAYLITHNESISIAVEEATVRRSSLSGGRSMGLTVRSAAVSRAPVVSRGGFTSRFGSSGRSGGGNGQSGIQVLSTRRHRQSRIADSRPELYLPMFLIDSACEGFTSATL